MFLTCIYITRHCSLSYLQNNKLLLLFVRENKKNFIFDCLFTPIIFTFKQLNQYQKKHVKFMDL
jgi:hypothetical protein